MVDSMITLFDSTATSFDTNGIGSLSDAISCEVTEERNGEFELEMEYSVNGKRYSDISLRKIITAKPNPYDKPQPFRIYSITKPINGVVTINAEHISYDLSGCIVSPFSASSAALAFEKMKANSVTSCPFEFWTDKTVNADMVVSKPVSIRSLLGGSEGSMLDIYGKGEYEFDNFTVKLHLNRGANRGVSIRYGKNLTDLTQEEKCSSVYTGVYPYWYSEQQGLCTIKEKIVSVEGTYDFERIYALDLSDKWQEPPTEEQLRTAAKQYITANNIGIPKVSLKVSFVQLAQSKEYETIALLEKIHLCDTVNVEFPKLNVSSTSKCISIKYDAITNKYIELKLGDSKTNLASTIVSQDKVISETPSKSFLEKAIDNATQLITGGLGGYVIIQSSSGGKQPDEILIMNTDDIKTATNVWRWNKNGLGYSSNGYNGPYATAITADGKIVADFILAGEFDGALIKAGSIAAEMLSVEYKTSVTNAISNARKEAEEYANSLKAEISKELEDVSKSVDDINKGINDAVADGIITESEKAAIKKMLQIVEKEKEEADAKCDELFDNDYASNTAISAMYKAWLTAFGRETSNLLDSNGNTIADSSGNAIVGRWNSPDLSKYRLLVNAINAVIDSENQEDVSKNVDIYYSAYKEYSTAVSNYQLAINGVIDSISSSCLADAKKYADNLKVGIDKELKEVNDSLSGLDEQLDYVASDGIITESEKATIQKMLQITEKEKEEADAKHDELFDNDYLPSAELNAMHKAWLAAFGGSNSAYKTLTNAIMYVLDSENKEEIDTNLKTYKEAFSKYSTAVSDYQLTINAAIDAISKEYAKDADDKLHETITKETTVLIENAKDSITLLCKTIEENNMHNYIVGGSFPDSTFADGWYATDGNTITTFLSKKCVKLQKTSSSSSYIRFNLGMLKSGTYRIRYKAATDADYEKTARIQSSLVSVSTTSAGSLKSTKWTTVERDITISADSTYNRYVYFYDYVQNTTVYITEIEVLGQFSTYAEAKIELHSNEIALRVTEDDVSSLIEQNAKSIRMKATTLAWSSTYSSMSENGKLKCTAADISGTFLCGSTSGYWTKLNSSGQMTGGYGNTQYGYIDYSASARNVDNGNVYHGLQIQGGCLRISVYELSTRKTTNISTLAYIGATRSFSYISNIRDLGNGAIEWTTTTVNFENGLLVSS